MRLALTNKRSKVTKLIVKVCAVSLLVAAIAGCGSQQPAAEKKEQQFSAEIGHLDSMLVASLARTGPHSGLNAAMTELFAWLEKKQIQPTGQPCGVFYGELEVPADSAVWEVCVPVPAGTKGDEKVEVRIIPGAEVAKALHVGPHEKISATYEKLRRWIDDNGYMIAGPALEFYHTNPADTPADSLKVDVAFPVVVRQDEE